VTKEEGKRKRINAIVPCKRKLDENEMQVFFHPQAK